jgi:hypothetical protein
MKNPKQYMPYFLLCLIFIILIETVRAYLRHKNKKFELHTDAGNQNRVTNVNNVIGRIEFLILNIISFIHIFFLLNSTHSLKVTV